MPVELSIIIVQYKIPELLERCISSIHEHAGDVSLEIIVVNNDTEDISKTPILSKFPKVVWLDAGYNAGFSRANNIGMRHASGEYILILNPDTEIVEGFLRSFVSFYKVNDTDNKLGLLGCRIISSVDQSLLIGSGLGFPSISKIIQANPLYIYLTRSKKTDAVKKYDPYVMHYRNHEIDFVSGASVMIKREKVEKYNLYFDEDFFLYSEDIEWAHRVKSKDLRNYFDAEIEVYHVNSASTGFARGKFFQMQISGYLYYLKTHGPIAYLFYGLVLWLNFKSNLFLLRRAKQYDELKTEREDHKVFSKYFLPILKLYYFSSAANKPYLRYDQ
ncbi:MAG: glycosyl transferase family 2 [Bacteroidetes bacterium]|nr:glycosyl transferase family 2 [Bacteroidota bacterium]